jgi:hypothetical protein
VSGRNQILRVQRSQETGVEGGMREVLDTCLEGWVEISEISVGDLRSCCVLT